MSFISADDVRRASGAPSSLISDTLIEQAIAIVEEEMQRWMNTAFTPTERIEYRNGTGTDTIVLQKNPVLSVRELIVNSSTNITPSTLYWDKSSGRLILSDTSESSIFTEGTKNTIIKYLYGLLIESSTSTATTADASTGTSVSLTVSDITGFSDSDWVEIYGMDGNREVAQISGTPTGTTIVVDKLIKTHESGSKVVKLTIPEYIKRYMEIEAAIYIAIYAIGGTYTFNTSYSLGELSVNKGEPYPQWREVIQRMINERKLRRATIKIRPSIMVN